jgi:hypothetical protein
VEFSGHVRPAEITGVFETVCADQRFDTLHYIIADYLKVDTHEVVREDADWIAALDSAHAMWNPRYMHAGVATEPGAVALIRHFLAVSKYPERVGLFSTVAEAREWIAGKKGTVFVRKKLPHH